MKSITYMMRYLTSILSTKNSKEDLHSKKIAQLEERIDTLERNLGEIAFCLQQLAASMTSIVAHTGNQQKDPVDDLLESLGKDDDGSGYLH